MNQSTRYTFVSLLILLILGGGWYLLHQQGGKAVDTTQAVQVLSVQDQLIAAQAANSAGLSPQAAAAASSTAVAPFPHLYTNAEYGFSFRYPDALHVGGNMTSNDGVTTILVQDAVQHIGFQIYITPFTDPDPVITAARVAQSLPDLVMRDAQEVQVGGSQGLSFLTKDASFGESRQVWIVHKSNLYQVSTYNAQSTLLEKVLATWVFGK